MTNRRCDDRLCLQVADVVIMYDQQKPRCDDRLCFQVADVVIMYDQQKHRSRGK